MRWRTESPPGTAAHPCGIVEASETLYRDLTDRWNGWRITPCGGGVGESAALLPTGGARASRSANQEAVTYFEGMAAPHLPDSSDQHGRPSISV